MRFWKKATAECKKLQCWICASPLKLNDQLDVEALSECASAGRQVRVECVAKDCWNVRSGAGSILGVLCLLKRLSKKIQQRVDRFSWRI